MEVYSAYNIIPDGFIVNKNPCNGKPSENVMANWQDELNNIESELPDLILYEYVQKLFIQEDWLLKVRRHLKK